MGAFIGAVINLAEILVRTAQGHGVRQIRYCFYRAGIGEDGYVSDVAVVSGRTKQ